jgi:uncharacterized tellurite resistance protein B-like protein
MTPNELNILKSLVVVAWADGAVEQPETSVIEGLLSAFDATEQEEEEVLDFAKQKRTLVEDLPLSELGEEDRELLLGNAALLTHADGEQTESEKRVLDKLVELLGFTPEKAREIIDGADDGALQLSSDLLTED